MVCNYWKLVKGFACALRVTSCQVQERREESRWAPVIQEKHKSRWGGFTPHVHWSRPFQSWWYSALAAKKYIGSIFYVQDRPRLRPGYVVRCRLASNPPRRWVYGILSIRKPNAQVDPVCVLQFRHEQSEHNLQCVYEAHENSYTQVAHSIPGVRSLVLRIPVWVGCRDLEQYFSLGAIITSVGLMAFLWRDFLCSSLFGGMSLPLWASKWWQLRDVDYFV